MKSIYLLPGDWAGALAPTHISTLLGSCVAVALYDWRLKSGALNHYLLPEAPVGESESTRYGSIAIPTIVNYMLNNGSTIKSLQAKIYGGGNVLEGVNFGTTVGTQNILFAEKTLETYRIPIIDSNTGGNLGRKIHLITDIFEVRHNFLQKAG
jgi:two-component system chemotaxis response regulator CheB